MIDFIGFENINIPIVFCNGAWEIKYKNRAAKKYFRSPRCHMSMNKYIAGETNGISEKCGSIIYFDIEGEFKKALCFIFRDMYAIIFEKTLQFEALAYDTAFLCGKEHIENLCLIFDIFAEKGSVYPQKDRFMFLDRIEIGILSALSASFSEKLWYGRKEYCFSVKEAYGFLKEKCISELSKIGYRVQIDIEDLDLGYDLFTDANRMSLVMLKFLCLALTLSDDKKCLLKVTAYSKTLRNVFSFSAKNIKNMSGKGISPLREINPYGYLNILPFEYTCKKIGWNIMYNFNDKSELNGNIILDINITDIFGKTVSHFGKIEKEKVFSAMEKNISDIFS